jgi:hypothetical protein
MPMTTDRRPALFATLAVGWTLLVLALCWLPHRALPKDETIDFGFHVPNLDKLIHVAMFAGFGALWMLAGRMGPGRAAVVAVSGLALAVISELGQMTTFVNRDASLMDGLADAVGVGLGIAAAFWAAGRSEKTVASAPRAAENRA